MKTAKHLIAGIAVLWLGLTAIAQEQPDAAKVAQAQQELQEKQLAATGRLREQLAAQTKDAAQKEKDLQEKIDALTAQNQMLESKLKVLRDKEKGLVKDDATKFNEKLSTQLLQLEIAFKKHNDPHEPKFNDVMDAMLLLTAEYLGGDFSFDWAKNQVVMKAAVWKNKDLMPNENVRQQVMSTVAGFGGLDQEKMVIFLDEAGRPLAMCDFKHDKILIYDLSVLDVNQKQ